MIIAGVDEAGRGPLAGPVVCAAVILPDNFSHPLIQDSKKLSIKKREVAFQIIKENALRWFIVSVGHKRIDQINILQASLWGMAYAAHKIKPDKILVDGNKKIPTLLPQEAIIGGDAKYPAISAASILAKVYRDMLMRDLDLKYPGYDFSRHSGYPTAFHREKVRTLGACKVHRTTFLKNILATF